MNYLLRPILAIFLVLSSVAASADSDLIGQWQLRVEGRMGIQTPILTVREADGKFSGSIGGARGQLDIETITATGNQFSFPFNMTTPRGEFNLLYSGTRDGDSLTGKVETPRGPVPFTGKRKSP
ncbi:MAG: hypothetical protein GKR90_24665 [Pseudomonadales bacterium]|nr:hypothetical protein [Pseudomonadales bacterium]